MALSKSASIAATPRKLLTPDAASRSHSETDRLIAYLDLRRATQSSASSPSVASEDFLGSDWCRLLPPVPVIQCREQKHGRHAGESAGDKKDAVRVNEAVCGAQVCHRGAGKPLQDLSKPGRGCTQERILRSGVSQIGQTRHVRYQRNAGEAEAEVVACHDQREKTKAHARERESRKCGGRSRLQNASDDERAHVAKLQ